MNKFAILVIILAPCVIQGAIALLFEAILYIIIATIAKTT